MVSRSSTLIESRKSHRSRQDGEKHRQAGKQWPHSCDCRIWRRCRRLDYNLSLQSESVWHLVKTIGLPSSLLEKKNSRRLAPSCPLLRNHSPILWESSSYHLISHVGKILSPKVRYPMRKEPEGSERRTTQATSNT